MLNRYNVEEALRLFGRRVRAARKALKLTIEQAAERADLNAAYLGEIERGEKRASFETIIALAASLEVAPIVLFQFDRAETDPAVLRQRISRIVEACAEQSLQQAYRVLQAITEP